VKRSSKSDPDVVFDAVVSRRGARLAFPLPPIVTPPAPDANAPKSPNTSSVAFVVVVLPPPPGRPSSFTVVVVTFLESLKKASRSSS
jgi:hypothetical protein